MGVDGYPGSGRLAGINSICRRNVVEHDHANGKHR
jgi:hypothetical protein